MKKINKKIAIVLFAMVWVFASCMDLDDGVDSLSSQEEYTTWGFMSVTGGAYYIKTDTKKTLKLEEFDNTSFGVKQGDRVYAKFRILNDESGDFKTNATYTHLVKVNKIYIVDYDSITKITEENKNTIKNGYVEVQGVAITANNLNLQLAHNDFGNTAHKIVLCYDLRLQNPGEPVQLDLKDSSGESNLAARTKVKLQSYNIAELETLGTKDGEGNIAFTVTTNRGTSNEKQFNLVYKP